MSPACRQTHWDSRIRPDSTGTCRWWCEFIVENSPFASSPLTLEIVQGWLFVLVLRSVDWAFARKPLRSRIGLQRANTLLPSSAPCPSQSFQTAQLVDVHPRRPIQTTSVLPGVRHLPLPHTALPALCRRSIRGHHLRPDHELRPALRLGGILHRMPRCDRVHDH
jgi:hypothetical protein